MATAELIDVLDDVKLDVFQRVKGIDDIETMGQIVECLDRVAPRDGYDLTPEDKEALRRSEEDYRNGRWITQEELQKKIVQWRNNKGK